MREIREAITAGGGQLELPREVIRELELFGYVESCRDSWQWRHGDACEWLHGDSAGELHGYGFGHFVLKLLWNRNFDRQRDSRLQRIDAEPVHCDVGVQFLHADR